MLWYSFLEIVVEITNLLTTAENLNKGGTDLCHFLSLVLLLFLWIYYFLKCWGAAVRLLILFFFLYTLFPFWFFFNWFSFWSILNWLLSLWRRQGDDLPTIRSFSLRRGAKWWRFIVECLRFLLRWVGLWNKVIIWWWFDGLLAGLWLFGSFPNIVVPTEQCPSLTISWSWAEPLGIFSAFLLIESFLILFFSSSEIQIILFVDLCQICISIIIWFHSIYVIVFENIVNWFIVALRHCHTVPIYTVKRILFRHLWQKAFRWGCFWFLGVLILDCLRKTFPVGLRTSVDPFWGVHFWGSWKLGRGF